MTPWSIFVVIILKTGFFVFTYGQGRSRGKYTRTSHEHLLARLFSKNSESKKSIPKPAEVNHISCGLYVNSFDSISESSMDFTVNMMLFLEWDDPRLNWTSFKSYKGDFVELDETYTEEVWRPDIYFPNEKSSTFHTITAPNRQMRIYRPGTIFYAIRITLTHSCSMDLGKYPLDKQFCSIIMQSFGFTSDKVNLKWTKDRPEKPYNPAMKIAQFEIMNYSYDTCHHQSVSHPKLGNRSCLKIEFELERNMGYYLVQTYVPSILIVMLSWVSFWLNVESVPARISMGVLTVLTMTTQSSGPARNLPNVSYTKAIDIWITACLVFVFAALIEFAVANVFARRDRLKSFVTKNRLYIDDDTGYEGIQPPFKQAFPNNGGSKPEVISEIQKVSDGLEWSRKLDIASRVLFPLTFALFNILYWCIYLFVLE